jgi:hypothetical protein
LFSLKSDTLLEIGDDGNDFSFACEHSMDVSLRGPPDILTTRRMVVASWTVTLSSSSSSRRAIFCSVLTDHDTMLFSVLFDGKNWTHVPVPSINTTTWFRSGDAVILVQ